VNAITSTCRAQPCLVIIPIIHMAVVVRPGRLWTGRIVWRLGCGESPKYTCRTLDRCSSWWPACGVCESEGDTMLHSTLLGRALVVSIYNSHI
jgi:hypothetical protein